MIIRVARPAAALALAGVAVLAGCGSNTVLTDPAANAQAVYQEAKDDLESGAYEAAIKGLTRVEALGAGTLLAQQAQIDKAYAQWKSGSREEALATLDRFIRYNPSSPAADYALYMRGVVNFNDSLGLFGFLAKQDLSERDQKASRDAYESFRQLVETYPQSRYAADARLRMSYIVNALAEHELHVARYYYARGAYVAAVNRAQQAVQDFQSSPAAEEALSIMIRSYDQLGLTALRDDARRVLAQSFPNSRFLTGAAAPQDKPWWKFW